MNVNYNYIRTQRHAPSNKLIKLRIRHVSRPTVAEIEFSRFSCLDFSPTNYKQAKYTLRTNYIHEVQTQKFQQKQWLPTNYVACGMPAAFSAPEFPHLIHFVFFFSLVRVLAMRKVKCKRQMCFILFFTLVSAFCLINF